MLSKPQRLQYSKTRGGFRPPQFFRFSEVEKAGCYQTTRLVAIVITIVPVALVAPAMFVLIPPTMVFAPATLARFVQVVTPVVRLTAVRAMMLDGFVKLVVSMRNAVLALLFRLSYRACNRTHQHQSRGHGQE